MQPGFGQNNPQVRGHLPLPVLLNLRRQHSTYRGEDLAPTLGKLPVSPPPCRSLTPKRRWHACNIPVVVVFAVVVVVVIVVVVASTLLDLFLMSPRELLKPSSTTTAHLDNCPVVLLQLASTKEGWQHRVAPLHLVAGAAKEERLISVHTSASHSLTTTNPTPCFLCNLLAWFAVVHFDNVFVVVVDARQVHLTVVCARLACLPSRQQLLQSGCEP